MQEFIEQLLQDKGVPADLDEAVRAQLVSDLTERATDFVNKYIVESLDDAKLAELEKLLDNQPDDIEAMKKFIDANVPNKEQLTGLALLEFRSLYLGAAA